MTPTATPLTTETLPATTAETDVKSASESAAISTIDFRPSVHEALAHYFDGFYPCYLTDDTDGPIGWKKYSHRGIQWLDKIHIGSSQKRYVFSTKFQVRYNTAFKDVLIGCADLTRQGHTWITPGLIDVYCKLHMLGFAHSFECWQNDKLVGGAFGIQIGGMMTVESMFHTVDHASKAAYGQALMRLKERGFKLVDVNNASEHFARFGAETVPQWQFEETLRDVRGATPSFDDNLPTPTLPLAVRIHIPLRRIARAVGRRFKRPA